MPDDDHADLIRRLSGTPGWLHNAVAAGPIGRSDDARREWGIRDIVGHVRAADAILSTRVFQVLVREGLQLPGFDERRWGELYAAAAVPLDDQVTHFAMRRAELAAVLRSLTPEQWLRSGEHEEAGMLTVADLCRRIVEHEAEHRAQLDQIVAAGGEA